MSLLMEALKKAEQAKQDTAAATPEETALSLESTESTDEKPSFPELDLSAGTDGFSAVPDTPPAVPSPAAEIAPPPPRPTEKMSEPAMELVLESAPPMPAEKPAPPPQPKAAAEPPPPRNEERPAAAQQRSAPPSPKRPNTATQQARNVFSAKNAPARPLFGLSKPAWAVVGIGIALLAVGSGYYFYREVGGGMPPNAQLTPPPLASQPSRPAAAPSPPALSAPPVSPAPRPAETAPASPAPAAEAPREHKKAETPDMPPERGDIRIQRGTPAESLNPNLTRAYQAVEAGKPAEAQDAYRKVLQSDRNNRDALLGLAILQERKGDADGAARLYQRLLELDPNDGAAQAGLTGLGEGDPIRAESRLKSLLSQQPDSDTLYFALGNLYAGQQRWAEAQQAYFRAFQKQPGNPDYLYNLAVSLDHLGQNKLARDYYRKALAAANRPHNFSPEEVGARIRALEQTAP